MFNLLPENLKSRIKSEYNLRRIIVICYFVIFIGATFLVFLFPSWIISLYKEKEISLQAEKNNQSTLEADVQVVSTNIKKINLELRTVNTSLDYKKVIPLIDTILSQRTNTIKINELTYTGEDVSNTTMFIEGISATRGALSTFVKKLEDTKLFKSVNLPISNFAKERDINFSITLTLEK